MSKVCDGEQKSVISSLNVEKQKAAAKQSHDINISRVNIDAYSNKDYKTGKQKYAEDIKKWKRAQQYGEQKLREVLNENRNVQITGIRRLGRVAMAAASIILSKNWGWRIKF